MLDLNDLNEEQLKAVTYGTMDPLLLVAGPGSGKTFTLTKRILYLILEGHILPEHILVLTFTKSAALEMQKRYMQMAASYSLKGSVTFGTFHSLFYSILMDSHHIFPNGFMNLADKQKILLSLMRKSKITEHNTAMERKDSLLLLDAFSYFKNVNNKEKTLQRLPPELREDFFLWYELYEGERQRIRRYDFDDLMVDCRKLFRDDPGCLERWKCRYTHLCLDEFQDINPVQYEILRMMNPDGHIFAVGDDDQAIYSFRGSSPDCMEHFVKDFKGEILYLNTNYRSKKEIVDNSLKVIGENSNRILKQLHSFEDVDRKERDGDFVDSVFSVKGFSSKEEELDHIKERIRESTRKGKTMAVLFRTNSDLQKTAAYLTRQNISYVTYEKIGTLYEHFIVKDLFAYLELMENSNNRGAFDRIAYQVTPYISREALARVKGGLNEVIDYYVSGHGLPHRNDVLDGLTSFRQKIKKLPGYDLFLKVFYVRKQLGYENYLRKKAGGRKEALEEWLEVLEWFSKEAHSYGKDFSAWKEGEKEFRKEGLKSAKETAVTLYLMTVHASKGLEFDTVIIPDCNEGTFPGGRNLTKEEAEEERRIFYVAMTRAKKRLELLFVSQKKDCSGPGVSHFLDSIRPSSHQIHNCQDIRQMHHIHAHILHRHQCNPEQAPR